MKNNNGRDTALTIDLNKNGKKFNNSLGSRIFRDCFGFSRKFLHIFGLM